MKARIAASVVIAAGVVLGTSGCNLLAPQATTYHYDPSDGVSTDVGELSIRNALVVSDGESLGNLVVTVVNSGDTAQQLEVQFDGADGRTSSTVEVDAGTTVFGPEDTGILLDGIDSIEGSLLPVYFQYGAEEGSELLVPVLGSDLAEYSTLAPTPAPLATSTPTIEPATESPATDSPAATPSPEATESTSE